MGVEGEPALPRGVFDSALVEQSEGRALVWRGWGGEFGRVRKQVRDGLLRIRRGVKPRVSWRLLIT